MSFDVPAIPYHELLCRSAEKYCDKVAIRFQHQVLTFADVERLSNQAAYWLASLGVGKGDRVALALYNCPEYIATFYAISKLGAVVVPVNASYHAEEALHVLRDAEAKVLLAADKLVDRLGHVPQVEIIRQAAWAGHIASQSSASPPSVPLSVDDDLVVLQYSSGTTGRPRGVMMSHRNLVASHLQYLQAGGVTEQDISLLFVPFVHVYGCMLMGGALAAGATQVVMERYHLERSLHLVQQHRVSLYYCTTAVVVDLVQSPLSRQYDLTSLRYINSGGAPLPREVSRMARQELGIPIANGYGMSEAPISGHLVPGEERKIVHAGPIMGRDQPGEIWIRGPQVMKGYWKDPIGTAEVLQDGWLRTGDVGYIDAKARLIITAREKEMIKYKGFAVSPTELEGLLLEHPAVADCTVVGQSLPDGNELPKAYLVLKNGGTAAEAVAAVNARVAEYKQIRAVEVVQSIPRNDAGKVLKRLLV